MNPVDIKARHRHHAITNAMKDGFTPSACNDEGRLAAPGDASVHLSAGNIDFHAASAVECSSDRNHGEAGMGRQLGDQIEVTRAMATPSKTDTRLAERE